ncbi:catalase [Parasphingopyxis sp. CP4]|uniref:catalase n=1 Tax=Parasphingopyxis sp. CP4 TaxID=2724527 RepID=UPI0015A43F2E|nr:catalase [Parasphingopyxis sp. CP4]QLC22003.1 catalase [Parasphingopyxis sp. CP4]
MDEPSIAQQLVDAIIEDFPNHGKGNRPIHTVGISAIGHFEGSNVAPDYCTAEHFQRQQVPVTVRFSNGAGSIKERDGWSDVRGMATRFHLKDDRATDLIMMTLGEFFVRTVDEFLEFAEASKETPAVVESAWSKIKDMLQLKPPMPNPYPDQHKTNATGSLKYANHHRSAQLAVFDAGTIGAPVSYVRATYNAVHTFVVTGPDGRHRNVRFQWQPVAGVKLTDPSAPPVDKYLHQELRDRLDKWPAKFLLLMTIGEEGDALDDPTRRWPMKRKRIVMGTLALTAIAEDQDADSKDISFNPCRLVSGIDLSDDPILAARKDAYEYSRELRNGTACPFNNE